MVGPTCTCFVIRALDRVHAEDAHPLRSHPWHASLGARSPSSFSYGEVDLFAYAVQRVLGNPDLRAGLQCHALADASIQEDASVRPRNEGAGDSRRTEYEGSYVCENPPPTMGTNATRSPSHTGWSTDAT
jgi:hypothetical protein